MGNKPFERQRWTSVDGVENLLDRKKRGEGCLRRGHAQLQFVQAKEKNLDIVYSRVLKRMLCEILPISRADVNKKDDLGLTPLTYAVEASAGRLIVESLLDWKADVNSKDFLGQKVFVHAIFKQHGHRALETAQMLLEANADVDTQDNRGRTPLMLAAMMLPVASDKLKWLVEKAGAALNVCDDEGNTAYDLAALAHRRIAFALHEKTSVDQGPFATYLMNYQRPEVTIQQHTRHSRHINHTLTTVIADFHSTL
eukprot:jgi/Bigna1/127933/aug1.5_g2641